MNGKRDRTSGIVPAATPSSRPMHAASPAPSRPRLPGGVDDTMDDVSVEPIRPRRPGLRRSSTPAPSFPPSHRGGTRAELGASHDARRQRQRRSSAVDAVRAARCRSDGPASARIEPPAPEPPTLPLRAGRASSKGEESPRRSRGLLFVVLCFVLGASLAAGWAWKMGKLGGGDGDDERYVTRATDAMYKNRFVAPARRQRPRHHRRGPQEVAERPPAARHPHARRQRARDRRRWRSARPATSSRRSASRVPRTSSTRTTHPRSASSTSTTPSSRRSRRRRRRRSSSRRLRSPRPTASPWRRRAVPSASASSAASSFKVCSTRTSAPPRVGQTVEFTARVAPTKGTFEGASFIISGPGLGGGATMPAQSPSPGVFKASYAFLEAGRFDVTFTTQADGKPLKAGRSLTAGEPPAPKPPEPVKPPPPPAPRRREASNGCKVHIVRRRAPRDLRESPGVIGHCACGGAHGYARLAPAARTAPTFRGGAGSRCAAREIAAEARAASRTKADAASVGRRALAHHRSTAHHRRARGGHHRAADRANLGGAERR